MKYTVIADDTFESIARKKYGTEVDAILIRSANPGLAEPLTEGVVIVVPDRPESPTIPPLLAPFQTENEVSVAINGTRFRFWETVRVNRAIDSMDSLEFTAPFEVDNAEFRDTFRPFSYDRAEVSVGGNPLFTGTILIPLPTMAAEKKTVSVSAYSLPGVLNDCPVPASSFPSIGFDGQNLEAIAKAVTAPFGLTVVFADEPGPVFERVALEPTKKVFEFLSDLARKRNLIVSSTPGGELLFQRAIASGKPVARLSQGDAPLISVTPQFAPQEYYSHVTGLQPEGPSEDGSQFTVKNPRLEGVIRPFTFQAEDTDKGNVKAAVEAKAARMFANVASYSINVSGWRDSQGSLWQPNTTMTLFAPGAMIYSEYEFLIRSVALARSGNRESTSLNLVIPEAFRGEIPEALPWEE